MLEIRRGAEPRVYHDAIAPDIAFDSCEEAAANRPELSLDVIRFVHVSLLGRGVRRERGQMLGAFVAAVGDDEAIPAAVLGDVRRVVGCR